MNYGEKFRVACVNAVVVQKVALQVYVNGVAHIFAGLLGVNCGKLRFMVAGKFKY